MASLPQTAEGLGAVPLGETAPSFIRHQTVMVIGRHRQIEQRL
jgi:hypothetical protein